MLTLCQGVLLLWGCIYLAPGSFHNRNRNTLWKILSVYGISPKFIHVPIIHTECSVIMGKSISESLPVQSRARRGYIPSPVFFLLPIIWITPQTLANKPRGIQGTLFRQLEDVDLTYPSSPPTTTTYKERPTSLTYLRSKQVEPWNYGEKN